MVKKQRSKKRLTQRQETFCLKYFELGNASEAALIAGYSARSIRNIASVNLTKTNIQERLRELRSIAEDESIATVLERKQILTDITRGNLTDYQETGADGAWLNIGKESPHTKAISEITSRTNEDNSVITKVKLHSSIQAIAELNKMEKIYSENIVNVDNRTLNINVEDPKGKLISLLSRLAIRAGEAEGDTEPEPERS